MKTMKLVSLFSIKFELYYKEIKKKTFSGNEKEENTI